MIVKELFGFEISETPEENTPMKYFESTDGNQQTISNGLNSGENFYFISKNNRFFVCVEPTSNLSASENIIELTGDEEI
jgi:hypothetical protein